MTGILLYMVVLFIPSLQGDPSRLIKSDHAIHK